MRAQVVVATTTFYRNLSDLRCLLTIELIKKARGAGHIIVIVDDSPDPTIAEYFRAKGALVFRQAGRGMAQSRREAFEHAAVDLHSRLETDEYGIILWTEEKPFIIEHIPKIIRPIVETEASAVIAKRSPAAFTTWPAFQAESEQAANAVYNEVTGRRSDPMFGPVAFYASLADAFINSRPEEYGVPPFAAGYLQHFGIIEIIAEGYRVADSEPLDVVYPALQKEQEETLLISEMRQKREQQMQELSEGYRIAAKALGIRPSSQQRS